MSINKKVIEKMKEAVSLRHAKRFPDALVILEDLLENNEANETAQSLYVDTLLKLGRYDAIVSCPFAGEIDPRSAAIAADLHQKNCKQIQKILLDPGHAMQQTAALLMIKNEEDIIGYNLRWLYHLGIRKFCILDNGSTDGTRAALLEFRAGYQDAELLIIDDPGVAYFQGAKTTGMFRFSTTYWPDLEWILPIDADEFLCCTLPLKDMLESGRARNADAIIVPKSFYYIAEDFEHTDELPFYRKISHRMALTHVSAKVILRNGDFTIGQGNHFIAAGKDRRIVYTGGYELGMHYREFPIRSLGQLREKIINGGPAVLEAQKKNPLQIGGGHWKGWYLQYQAEGESAFEKIFRGMMKKGGSLIKDPLPLEVCLPRSAGA